MKAILEFDLPDDQEQFTVASQAQDWYLLAWDMDQWLRNRLRYHSPMSDGILDELQKVQDMLKRLLEERGLNLETMT